MDLFKKTQFERETHDSCEDISKKFGSDFFEAVGPELAAHCVWLGMKNRQTRGLESPSLPEAIAEGYLDFRLMSAQSKLVELGNDGFGAYCEQVSNLALKMLSSSAEAVEETMILNGQRLFFKHVASHQFVVLGAQTTSVYAGGFEDRYVDIARVYYREDLKVMINFKHFDLEFVDGQEIPRMIFRGFDFPVHVPCDRHTAIVAALVLSSQPRDWDLSESMLGSWV